MKALKKKNKYKNTDKWLDAVYRKNKDYIDSRLEKKDDISKRKQFKDLVNSYLNEGYTARQAINRVEKSKEFATIKDESKSTYVDLKAEYNKGSYKNTDEWLNAVYSKNKKFIDSKIETTGDTDKGEVFKSLVNEYIEEGYSPKQAVKKLEKSTVFTDVKDRLKQNAYTAIKHDKEAFKQFRELTKNNGRYTTVDVDKFQYDKDTGNYIYGNIVISFSNSPYTINFSTIEN